MLSTASTASVSPDVDSTGRAADTPTSSSATTPPSLDVVDRYAAIGSGAPSYVAGAQAWAGTAATLNPSPTSSSTTPTLSSAPVAAPGAPTSTGCPATCP